MVWPSTTLPKLKLAGEIARPACAPLPVTGIVNGELPALLTIVMVPVVPPAAVGSKETVRVAFWEGLSVAGVVIPLVVTPAPTEEMDEIFTAAVPVFVKVICFCVVVPVATAPKLRLVGFDPSWPVAADVPLPLKGTVIVGLAVSLLVIARLPVALPVAVGVKVTAIVADCPAEIVFGVVTPLMVNSAPVSVSNEIVTSVAPVLLSTRLLLPFEPTDTLPKLTLDALNDNCDCALTADADKFTITGALPPSA